jgi:hypothetical protein
MMIINELRAWEMTPKASQTKNHITNEWPLACIEIIVSRSGFAAPSDQKRRGFKPYALWRFIWRYEMKIVVESSKVL